MDARVAILAASLSAPVAAAQLDITTFNTLRRGMSESEVLLRAGEPDRVTTPGGHVPGYGAYGGAVVDSGPRIRLHYLPGPQEHDPWLTIVTLTHGRVSDLERIKLLTPPVSGPQYPGPASRQDPTSAPARAPSDEDLLRERAERTLEAAERYAEVRARLKEGTAGTSTLRPPVYRGTDAEGAPYFGDVPAAHGSPAERP